MTKKLPRYTKRCPGIDEAPCSFGKPFIADESTVCDYCLLKSYGIDPWEGVAGCACCMDPDETYIPRHTLVQQLRKAQHD